MAWCLAVGMALAGPVHAAASAGCEGGGFVVQGLADGGTVAADGVSTIPTAAVGADFLVGGRYVEFRVVSASFGVANWTLTGAENPLDLTGGRRTEVFAAKTPDHRGLVLTSDITVDRSGDDIVLEREGPGLRMKIQSKDCAQGGIFQMEVERDDGTRTRYTHVLAEGVFYFDNPNFRAREGDVVPFTNSRGEAQNITITPRINFANDASAAFVGRDSPQVATRVQEAGCVNQIAKRDGTTETVRHCGGISRWDVASGGRMGQVMGEDSTEVAPPATNCVEKCQAQNRVRGGAVVLGFPFPVPEASPLQPRFPVP
jgi:hypothetical protein